MYDEIVSEALETRLTALERTDAIDLADVLKDSDVDELVRLVRDEARIATADIEDSSAFALRVTTRSAPPAPDPRASGRPAPTRR